jgi:hypothetical protein
LMRNLSERCSPKSASGSGHNRELAWASRFSDNIY